MPMRPEFRVEGLKELRRELKLIDPKFAKELRTANKQAADAVVPVAQRLAGQHLPNVRGGMARAGSAGIASIRSGASQSSSYILSGGTRAPWMPGRDWGTTGKYGQFPAKNKRGYILYPAIDEATDEILDTYNDAIGRVVQDAFPE